MSVPVVIVGAGGHARVLAATLQLLDLTILGIVDPIRPKLDGVFEGLRYLGDDVGVREHDPGAIRLVNGVGSAGNTTQRARLFTELTSEGYDFASVVHPTAEQLADCVAGAGLQVMACAVVGVGTTLGENVLINTGAIVDHSCHVGDHCHVASGAVICGDCEIGAGVHVGAGSTIIQGLRVGDGACIAAGSVVTKDVPPGVLVAGVPAIVKRHTL